MIVLANIIKIKPSYGRLFWFSGDDEWVYPKKLVFDHVTLIKVKGVEKFSHAKGIYLPQVVRIRRLIREIFKGDNNVAATVEKLKVKTYKYPFQGMLYE